MFDKKIYIERRNILSQKVSSGIILLLGNELSPINYADNEFRFRQDSSFLYYFGINVPLIAAIIDIDSGKEIVFGDPASLDSIVWTGKLPTLNEQAERFGVKRVLPTRELFKYLHIAQLSQRTIHFIPQYRSENKIKLHQLLEMSFKEIDDKYSVELVKAIVSQREIKSEDEINEIERAVDISIDMHLAAIKMTKPGMSENEIAAEVNRIPLSHGGDIAFPIIATINGQTLHNHYHGNIIKEGDLFLLDAGAELPSGYCGDLSSTFPVSKTFTTQQREIYNLSLKAHKAAIQMIKPGVAFREVHFEACRTIINGLKEIGLMKGDTEEAIISGAHAMFFPCGTGHMMGLDVHDMENLGEVWVGYNGEAKSTQFGLKSLRLAKELKPGFVFTIEPGIYFIPDLIDRWKADKTNIQFLNFENIDKFRGFGGIRNEENIVVTTEGFRLLGREFPKTIEEIEKLRAS
jgi:Xaa-Pro aminopeptidase